MYINGVFLGYKKGIRVRDSIGNPFEAKRRSWGKCLLRPDWKIFKFSARVGICYGSANSCTGQH
jgi:hypothetical protein